MHSSSLSTNAILVPQPKIRAIALQLRIPLLQLRWRNAKLLLNKNAIIAFGDCVVALAGGDGVGIFFGGG